MGFSVGTGVQSCVGVMEGVFVGAIVGVGAAVGFSVGTGVESVVGVRVGFSLGSLVRAKGDILLGQPLGTCSL